MDYMNLIAFINCKIGALWLSLPMLCEYEIVYSKLGEYKSVHMIVVLSSVLCGIL